MEQAGDIYLDRYAGWYSVRQEAYFDEEETTSATTACAASRSARRSNGWRRRAISSASRPIRTGCSRSTSSNPNFIAPHERRNEVVSFVKARAEGSVDLAHHLRLGRAGARRPEARHVRVGRRAHQLHHRRRLSR